MAKKTDEKKETKETKEAPLISLAEIASVLKMSLLQVRKMAQTGQIPAVKMDGEWRFNRDLVYQAVQQRSRRR
jgi:excisionase family DNA binding protein